MAKLVYDDTGRLLFTKEMKEEYTILMPQMLPVHFGMFQRLLELEGYAPRKVLNQWTFQSRMYNAARYVCTQPDMQVAQLVSFGCGTDAITTDEMRSILEDGDKLYTQLKIDDISNLGAVKIRIRSLMAAIDARKEN